MPDAYDEPTEDEIDELPKLGELARMFDIPHAMIHYYERAGLITGVVRDRYGRRRYSAKSQDRIRLLLDLRELGFPVAQIQTALGPVPAEGTSDEDGTRAEQLASREERLSALEYLIDQRLRSGRRARATVRGLRAQLYD